MIEQEVLTDFQTLGLTLRAHPMALLRIENLFNRCTRANELVTKRHGGFIRVAGVVRSRNVQVRQKARL